MPNTISMWTAAAVSLGAIIGAGIFVLSGTAIALAGANALFAFILVGLIAVIIALEFGELESIMPKEKGAAFSYAFKAFGSELGFMTGIILYFSYATSISAISLGFGSYLTSMLGLSASWLQRIFAILLIAVLSIVNLLGIKKASKVDAGIVTIKIGILLLFILFAIFIALYSKSFSFSNFSVGASQKGISAIFAASVVIFFAYSGFQTISTFASKVRGGPVAAAKAIIISVIVSMALYILVVFALLLLAPASAYKISADPLSFALLNAHAPSWLFIVVDFGALLATTSATLAMILSSSRILYQIGANKLLPRAVSAYDKRKDVATNGVIISAVIGVVMLFSGNIYVIAAISNFGLLFSYMMATLAVMHFRRIHAKRSFSTPLYPYSAIVAIVMLLLFMFGMPKYVLLIGVLLILSLIIIYYFLRELKNKPVVRVKLFS